MTFIMNLKRHHFTGVYFAQFQLQMNKMSLLKNSSQSKSRAFPMIFLGLGLLLIVAAAYFLQQNPTGASSNLSAIPVKVDYPAPELSLTDMAGNSDDLANFRGQVVLVNLWATWCPPCKEEMPALETFYRKHADDGFAIVAVNDGDPTADVVRFVKDYGLTFPVWLDPTYIATEKTFKTLNLPSSFVINRDGQIVLSWVGGVNLRTLEEYVTPIIEGQP
jgi:cytochrome c biogenesis protein CcmG/thiol:disulfide interchange protein DsbE